MGRRAALAATILAGLAAGTYAATARLYVPDHDEQLSKSAAPAVPVEPFQPSTEKYVNFRPLVGILSQACHSCPGK